MWWKTLGVAVIVAAVLIGWRSAARAQEAAQPLPPEAAALLPDAANHGPELDVPRRIARDFAPWIKAVIMQKPDQANRIFQLRHSAQETAESANALRIFRKFPKLDGIEITLVGGRTLGDQTGVLLFTAVTEHGPVAFKVYHYKFDNTRAVGKLEITDDWADIERLYTTIDPLQNTVTVPL